MQFTQCLRVAFVIEKIGGNFFRGIFCGEIEILSEESLKQKFSREHRGNLLEFTYGICFIIILKFSMATQFYFWRKNSGVIVQGKFLAERELSGGFFRGGVHFV